MYGMCLGSGSGTIVSSAATKQKGSIPSKVISFTPEPDWLKCSTVKRLAVIKNVLEKIMSMS